MICEYCNKEHSGIFGSGRFCNIKCARAFSTKDKRKEINKKVSETLKKIKIKEKICPICKNVFTVNLKNKTCSKKCAHILIGLNQRNKNKKSGKYRKSGSGGFREGGGRCIQISYTNHLNCKMKLNKEEIKIANILDELKLNWDRNKKGFLYFDLNKNKRKYYPDFYIKELNLYVEYKGWVTEKINHKMNDSLKRNNFNLLIVYSMDKRYKNLGINLSTLKEYLKNYMRPNVPR